MNIKQVTNRYCRRPGFLIVVAMLAVSNSTLAATQGEWGRTSTATVKITLRIHPQDHQKTLGDPSHLREGGHRALESHCNEPVRFNHPSRLFTASFSHDRESTATAMAEVDQLLRASCQGNTAIASARQAPLDPEDEQLTVLIAPL